MQPPSLPPLSQTNISNAWITQAALVKATDNISQRTGRNFKTQKVEKQQLI